MNRKAAWMMVGALALFALGFGLSSLLAQIVFQPDRGSDGLRISGTVPGRFQVASSTADGIILLDTATGELYRARQEDVKPYFMKPRVAEERGGWRGDTSRGDTSRETRSYETKSSTDTKAFETKRIDTNKRFDTKPADTKDFKKSDTKATK